MKSDYIVGIPIMVLNTFCAACMSVLYDLAIDSGFNIFEIMFLRGFIGLICGIMYDTSKKCLQSKRKQDIKSNPNHTTFTDTSVNLHESRDNEIDYNGNVDEKHSLLTITDTSLNGYGITSDETISDIIEKDWR